MAAGASPPEESHPQAGPPALAGFLARPLTRRSVVIAGSGVVIAGGTALLAKEMHIAGKVYARLRGLIHYTRLPAPNPHPLPDGPMSTPRDIVIFDGALGKGWNDWSWARHTLPDRSVSYAGKPVITMAVDNWGGLQLTHDAFDAVGLGYVQCWVRGADAGGEVVYLHLQTPDGDTSAVSLGDYTKGGGIAKGEWRLARVPLSALGFASLQAVGLVLQAGAAQSQGVVNLADLRVVYHPDLNPARVVKSWAYDLGTMTLAFDQFMVPEGAADPHAYLIVAAHGTNDPAYPASQPVAPVAARYHVPSRTVSLTLPKPVQRGGAYTVSVAPLTDLVGVKTAPGTHATVNVTSQPLTVALDLAAGRHAISREIYGIAGVGGKDAAALGATVSRWGGNAVTRYNWKLGNAFNAARDWHFQNTNYGNTSPADRRPSGVADQAVAGDKASGVATLLTIPAIGWVAKDDSTNSYSVNVPDQGGPPLQPNGDAIQGYDPTDNRRRTSVQSRARKGSPFADPPDPHDPTVAQDEWVYHLVRQFGTAAQGGVRYYAMDNEPDLWFATHTDIRPADVGYDQMRDIFLQYASAVKDVDPSALVTGPVVSGWTGYFYSALDRGTDNFRSHADRGAHGDMPFLEWWLSAIRRHDERAGRRTLDVLDLHFYPQAGEYSDNTGRDMSALRLRSTRALWDPSYSDESWIGEPVRLIPRMRDWVNRYYPGTKIALTEWNWGAEGSANGAVALAEVLGIFGREGLDMACHWRDLAPSQPAYTAFKLFGNYDDEGSSFLGTSFSAVSTKHDLLSCFAAQEDSSDVLLIVVNKSADSDLTPEFRFTHLAGSTFRRARVWRFWPDDHSTITRGPDVTLQTDGAGALALSYTFPATSVTLLRLEAGA